ncbi:HEAT repeat-containing protein, partial [Toxoplasma gondii GAB2-2007-GAL-DOM2]
TELQAAAASLGSTGALGADQGACVAATACATKTNDEETPEGLQNCRKYAIEALLCCVEQKSQVMLRVPNFLNRLLEALLMCMLDIRDSSYAKWLEEGEEEDEQRFFDVGEEGLDRICRAYSSDEDLAVGSRTQAASILLPALFNYVTTFLQRPEWEYRFVALMAISQTIEYVQEDQEEELDYIAKTLMRYLGDGDFRVRFAAAQAIGQMSLDQTPYVQEQFASEMLPLLIARMDDEVPRVQGHACAAFVNFSEEVEKAEMLKVAGQVMEKLLTKIRPGTQVFKSLQDEDGDVDSMVAEAAGLNDCLSKAGGEVFTDEEEDGLSLWPLFMPRLIQCLLSSDARVLQAAAYGVQQGALLQQAFQPFVQEAAKNLLTAVNRIYRTDFSDSDLNEEIKKLFAQINASGQPAPLAALCQNFTAKEQKKLQKILK